MKVKTTFTCQGLELDLFPENDQEKAMIGAVLNQPFEEPETNWGPKTIDGTLVNASVHYDGHWSNKKVSVLTLRVLRQENSGRPTDIGGEHG